MARIVGNDGAAVVDMGGTNSGVIFNVWNANILQPIADASGYGDAWARKRGGLKSGTFSAGGHAQFGASGDSPGGDTMDADGGTVLFTAGTGCSIGGTAIVGNINYASDQAGEFTISMDGEFDDTVTETWAEA